MRPVQVSAMHPRGAGVALIRRAVGATAASVGLSLALCPVALGAAPAPCAGGAQIADDVGDGHHANTDVSAAWFSEQAGRLQVVVKAQTGDWVPAHEDSEAAGWAVIFAVGGEPRYVRIEGPRTGPARYDHGVWTLAGGFASAGATSGETVSGPGGTVTIDVPAATGALPGALLARPFVLTYDGMSSPAAPHWVDRAPGGVGPAEAAFGADYVVGSCLAGLPGGPGGPGGPGAGTPGDAATPRTTGVVLNAPRRLTGAGRVRASGRIVPARGSVSVRITARPSHSRRAALVRSVRTLSDGSFVVSIPLSESSTITALADGISAQTRSVTVRSTVRLTLRRLAGGRTSARGVVSPRLPGRVLLLRTNAVVPSATAIARNGRFRFPTRRRSRGRYQAVFIPSGGRAERSTSRTGVVR